MERIRNLPRLALAIALALTALNSPVMAGNKDSQFGLVYGSSVPDADNTKPYWMVGLKGSAFLLPELSVGGYFLNSDETGQPSATDRFRYSLHGVQAAYHFGNDAGETFVAVRGGLSKVHMNPDQNHITMSPFHYGGAVGYDRHFTSWLSFGIEGSFTHVMYGKTRYETDVYDQRSFNVMSFLMAVQFRL